MGIASLMHASISEAAVDRIEAALAPGKVMLAESGWLFLINDGNGFLRTQFGEQRWDEAALERAAGTIAERHDRLKRGGTLYRKIIIPEKSVVYRDRLPRCMAPLMEQAERPGPLLSQAQPGVVSYLGPHLAQARSLGQLYFRGDTHTNWLGAFLVYRFIAELLAAEGRLAASSIASIADLTPSVAAYDGDLYVQLDPEAKAECDRLWGFVQAYSGFDLTLALTLPAETRRAARVEVPGDYRQWFTSRETLVYERADAEGLRAVVFRDSTIDFCLDLIAEHFARTVFVWHQGLVYREVLEREKPDVVLHVMAERFVTRYDVFPAFSDAAPASLVDVL